MIALGVLDGQLARRRRLKRALPTACGMSRTMLSIFAQIERDRSHEDGWQQPDEHLPRLDVARVFADAVIDSTIALASLAISTAPCTWSGDHRHRAQLAALRIAALALLNVITLLNRLAFQQVWKRRHRWPRRQGQEAMFGRAETISSSTTKMLRRTGRPQEGVEARPRVIWASIMPPILLRLKASPAARSCGAERAFMRIVQAMTAFSILSILWSSCDQRIHPHDLRADRRGA